MSPLTAICQDCGHHLAAYTRAGLRKALDHHRAQAHPETLED